MMTIASYLKRVSYFFVLATKPQDIPEILKCFVKFLKEEPVENFESTSFEDVVKGSAKRLPLTLNEKALKDLKIIMAPYPSVLSAGILPETSSMNFLYILGQFLTVITFVLETKFEKEPWLKSLFKIWGNREKMNARALVDEYSGKNSSAVKKEITGKLNESLKIITDPLLEPTKEKAQS
jgi:hypothetical protein